MVDRKTTPGHIGAQTEESSQHEHAAFCTSNLQGKSEVSFSPKEMTSHPQEQAYSVFTKSEKDIAVFLVTFAATFLSFVLIHLFSSYKCPLCLTQSVGREDKSHRHFLYDSCWTRTCNRGRHGIYDGEAQCLPAHHVYLHCSQHRTGGAK